MSAVLRWAGALALCLLGCAPAPARAPSTDDMSAVAPALGRFTAVRDDLWKRPGLSARDRSMVTFAALVARGQTLEMRRHLERALDDGVKPGEASEIITHLAFYTGWANAEAAVPIAKEVFQLRGVGAADVPGATMQLLPLEAQAEAERASRVEKSFGALAPGVVALTTDVLFRDLWLRPALAARDRSLVTVAALIATGQVAQVPYHLGRAMDHGLTSPEVAEMLAQLAFYTGWPSVFSSLPVVKEVLEKRAVARAAEARSPGSDPVEITSAGSRSPKTGSPDNFTGSVLVTQLFATRDRTRTSSGSVAFQPGARSFWHSHPLGQTLVVTEGTGWVQAWGGAKHVMKAGDVVWTPPGVKHWHGATSTEGMTHTAIQESVDGKAVEWMEPVTDDQYRR